MTAARHPGPTAAGERSLAPDLARGVMLLCIALANSHFFLPGSATARNETMLEGLPTTAVVFAGFPTDIGGVDRIVAWFISTFVDERAYPMFGALFGYGVARIAARHAGATAKAVRRLLWRRSGALIAVGLVHGLLLYSGDVLVAYGVVLLLGASVVRWQDGTLLVVAAACLLLVAWPDPDALLVSGYIDVSMHGSGLVDQIRERASALPYIATDAPFFFGCPFLVGLWAGRRRILERPGHHDRLLRRTALFGLAVAVAGAQPVALAVAGVVGHPGPGAMAWFGPLHTASGTFGGLAYAALIALAADRLARRPGRAVTALAATGERSMTCYLAQSVVWFVAFSPSVLDLAGHLTVSGTALLATATWLATVVLADRMRAGGQRGPFEQLTRRMTYGRRTVVDGG